MFVARLLRVEAWDAGGRVPGAGALAKKSRDHRLTADSARHCLEGAFGVNA